MLPINRILCPTDFSEPSLEAMKAAVELAVHFNAKLCLVHVVAEVPRPGWTSSFGLSPEVYAVELRDYEAGMRRSADRKLRELAEAYKAGSLLIETVVGSGDSAAEIVRIADEQKADLITISTHGLSGWRLLVYGSVTERVLRLAHCPVLTIRAPTRAV